MSDKAAVTPRENVLIEVIGDVMLLSKKRTDARIAALEARIATLESLQRKTLADAWAGDYLPRHRYVCGQVVRHKRDQWIALDDTDGVPGQDAGWKLFLRGA